MTPPPVTIPIDGVLDLHTFRPDEVKSLLNEYFNECINRGIFSVRVIHGKGTGVLKKKVWAALAAHPRVETYGQAPPSAGGWGATIVSLLPPE
ncbi:MAG: Smr/MutS family protein [Desulfosudaceae bacterium]